MSTDGKQQRRWIYVTPLHNHHHNETKGNDVSGHTGKRTVMKVSNATTIPITLSAVHRTNNFYKNFNHNTQHKVNNINHDDNDIQNGNVVVPRTVLNTRQNVEHDNRKLDFEKLNRIEWSEKATIHKNFQQSNNGITNTSNDEHQVEEESSVASFENDENGRSFYHRRRHGFNPFDKNLFANDGVVKNGIRLPPLIKNDFVKNDFPNGNDLSTTYQRYAVPTTATTQSSFAPIPSFRRLQSSNKNDYYRLIEGRRHRKYILRSNPFYSDGNGAAGNKYGYWDGQQHKPLDPVMLQLMFTHHESILPQPHFWGIRGYGLYSFAAGNDLHNNLPNGGYKVERDFDN